MPSAVDEVFDSASLIERLAAGGVDFLVIGGVAGGAHGSAYGTLDLDIAYARDPKNLGRLADVLRSLDARLRDVPPGVPFLLDARTLQAGANFTFTTKFGSLDIFGDAAGAPSYERLKKEAITIDVRGQRVLIASLSHLIAMKEAVGRTKDKLMATEYRMLADETPSPE